MLIFLLIIILYQFAFWF